MVRTTKAKGPIVLGVEAFEIVKQGTCLKGDVLTTIRIAAISAAKMTPAIVPLCHPFLIESVDVAFTLNQPDKSVCVSVTVKSSDRTGVEMEALVGASAACLTIYDMLKYQSRDMVMTEIRLVEKTGGKGGNYRRQD